MQGPYYFFNYRVKKGWAAARSNEKKIHAGTYITQITHSKHQLSYVQALK